VKPIITDNSNVSCGFRDCFKLHVLTAAGTISVFLNHEVDGLYHLEVDIELQSRYGRCFYENQ
jgi:hypothetical protein